MDNNILFYAFYQGIVDVETQEGGNCTSVALIKAAIDAFGLDSVFKANSDGSVTNITLRNNQQLQLTKEEIGIAANGSKFNKCEDYDSEEEKNLIEKIFNYAHLCFAVIVKNIQVNGNYLDGSEKITYPDFKAALEAVNEGLGAPTSFNYLGLEKNYKRMGILSSTQGVRAIVGWSAHHTVYISDGYYDKRGIKKDWCQNIMEDIRSYH